MLTDEQLQLIKQESRYQPRYIFVPLQDIAVPQLPGQMVPAGRIVAIEAPERRTPMANLPDGAEIVRREGPEGNIAVYLDQPAPILSALVSQYAPWGVTEITALRGMPAVEFYGSGLNQALFGEPPKRTYAEIMEVSRPLLDAAGDKPGTQLLRKVAEEVRAAVDVCYQQCRLHMQNRHAEIEDINNQSASKRYSLQDLRALAFAGIPRRQQYMEERAGEQKAVAVAVPAMLKAMTEQSKALAELTETLKAIRTGGVNSGAGVKR